MVKCLRCGQAFKDSKRFLYPQRNNGKCSIDQINDTGTKAKHFTDFYSNKLMNILLNK